MGLGLVVEPQVDHWLWTDGSHTAKALGWKFEVALRAVLAEHELRPGGLPKPPDPKRAAEWAARRAIELQVLSDAVVQLGLVGGEAP